MVELENDFSSKRVVFVVNRAAFFVSHRLALGQEALRRGCEVHVVAPQDGTVETIRAAGFYFHDWQMARRGVNPLSEFKSLLRLRKILKSLQPDLLHLVTIKPVLYGGLIARRFKLRSVFAVSGMGYLYIDSSRLKRLLRRMTNFLYRVVFKNPRSRIIVQNPDDQKFFFQLDPQLKLKTVLILGSGVDPQKFPELPEPNSDPVILLPTRLLWDKGVGEFLAAAKIIKQDRPQVRFVLAGEIDPGNPAAVSEDQVLTWQKEGTIEWWGFQKDMVAVFAKANIVCLPSYREGLPRVLIEAASCGRAIVTTDVPGCREIVKNFDNGFLVPLKDADSLAEALKTLLDNPDRRLRMGQRGRQRVLGEFSLDRVMRQTFQVYEQLFRLE